jgi:hypothetical protein
MWVLVPFLTLFKYSKVRYVPPKKYIITKLVHFGVTVTQERRQLVTERTPLIEREREKERKKDDNQICFYILLPGTCLVGLLYNVL